jgi:hypothetical protein
MMNHRDLDGYLLTPVRQFGAFKHLTVLARMGAYGSCGHKDATLAIRVGRWQASPYRYALITLHGHPAVVQGCLRPVEFAYMARFVHRNRAILLAHWRGEIDSFEFVDALRPPRIRVAPRRKHRRP